MDLSFSGAGFMGCYYIGVADCLRKYIPPDRIKRVAGASAGALIACHYLLDLPMSDALREIVTITEGIRQRTMGVFDRNHQVVDMLPAVLDKLLPENAHKIVSGRMHICITRLKDMKKILVSEFETRKDLIDALNCSCFIPVWSGNHFPTYKGVKHIDGGFTDNLPVFDEHTIRICCFSGSTDISPFDRTKLKALKGKILNMPLYFNLANFVRLRKALFPPPAQFFLDLVERGFHDTKQFILSNDLIKCEPCYKSSLNHLPVLPSITPLVSPSVSPAGSFKNLPDITVHGYSDIFLSSPKSEKQLDPLNNCNRDSKRASEDINERLEEELGRLYKEPIPYITIKTSDFDEELLKEGDFFSTGSGDSFNEADVSSAREGSPESLKGCKVDKKSKRKSQKIKKSPTVSLSATNNTKKANPFDLSSNLLLPEKFTMAPNSSPPSPCIKRHCKECLRQRQEIRLDNIEEMLRDELHKFTSSIDHKTSGRTISPITWLRWFRKKSTYKLQPL